jgi:hypothetical protein
VFDLATDGVKERRMASMNQSGTSVPDDELIEGNRRSIRPQRDSKNIVGNFIHTGFHRGLMFAMKYLDRTSAVCKADIDVRFGRASCCRNTLVQILAS